MHSRNLPPPAPPNDQADSDDEWCRDDLSASDVPPPLDIRSPLHPLANSMKNNAPVSFRNTFPPLRSIYEDDESPFAQSVEGPREIDPSTLRHLQRYASPCRQQRPPNPKPDPPGVRATPRKRVDSWPSSPHNKGISIWNMVPGPHRDPTEDWFLADDVVGLPLYSDPESDLDSNYDDETILDSDASDSDDSDWTPDWASTSTTASASGWESDDLDSLASEACSLLGHPSDSSIKEDPDTPPTIAPTKLPPPPSTTFLLTPAMVYADPPPPAASSIPKPKESKHSPFLTPRTSNRSLPTLFANLATSSSPNLRPTMIPPASIPLPPPLDQELPPPPDPLSRANHKEPPGKSPFRSPSPERQAPAPPPPPLEPKQSEPASTKDPPSDPPPNPPPAPNTDPAATSPPTPGVDPSIVASQLAIYDEIQRNNRSLPPADGPTPDATALPPATKPSTLFRVGTCLRRLAVALLPFCLARHQDSDVKDLATPPKASSPSEASTASSPGSA